jgi:hypothetical protein
MGAVVSNSGRRHIVVPATLCMTVLRNDYEVLHHKNLLITASLVSPKRDASESDIAFHLLEKNDNLALIDHYLS